MKMIGGKKWSELSENSGSVFAIGVTGSRFKRVKRKLKLLFVNPLLPANNMESVDPEESINNPSFGCLFSSILLLFSGRIDHDIPVLCYCECSSFETGGAAVVVGGDEVVGLVAFAAPEVVAPPLPLFRSYFAGPIQRGMECPSPARPPRRSSNTKCKKWPIGVS